MSINAQPVGIIMLLAGMFGLYFLTVSLRNSAWGILVLAYTGFMGYALGLFKFLHPLHGQRISDCHDILGATGVIFFAPLLKPVSPVNYSYMGGLISVAILTAFMVGLGAMLLICPCCN